MHAHMDPRAVVIVGGGVGAVEALLALTDLGEHAFHVTLLAPNDRFVLRAHSVAEPFAAGQHSDAGALADIARKSGALVKQATVTSIDAQERTVHCADGDTVPYDSLILAPGARPRQAFEQALTFGLRDPLALNGLLADLEQGYSSSVAFVLPESATWPLPLYELALMTARQVWGMNRDVELSIVTPEPGPLAIFGPEASAAVGDLLAELNITLHCGGRATVARGRVRVAATGLDLAVDRIVSLPVLDGPGLAGVPADARGFIPVDEYCRVRGLDGVYAIGDATDLEVKQGGLACQQADVAARHIAHEAGGAVDALPLTPVLRGRLLTGRDDHFMRRELSGEHGAQSPEALWWPPAKVYGHYLSPWLAGDRLPGLHGEPEAPPPPGIDVAVPLRRDGVFGPNVLLELDPLGAMHD